MKTKIYHLLILDKSGSMSSIANAAISGVNETIASIQASAKKHEEDQEHFFSLLAFCGCERKYIFENVPAAEIRQITAADYQPCCMTPLYDAIGLSVNRLMNTMEKDEGALAQVTIITDGYENDSKEYSQKAVKGLIERQRAKNWTFAFIGANQDVESVAFSLSINNHRSFEADDAGTRSVFAGFCGATELWADKVAFCMKSNDRHEMESISNDFFQEDDDKK